MALVPSGNGSGFFFTVTLADNGNNTVIKEYALRSADFATAQTDVAEILVALKGDGVTVNGVTNSEIVATSLSYRETEDSISLPASGVENEIKARVSARLADSNKKATFDIPAPRPEIFLATSGDSANIVDINDAELNQYADLFKSTGVAFISDGEDLETMLRGRRVSVKRGLRA